MKVLTLYQPYATLIMLGLKTFETRSWDAKKLVGQTIAIHSAASMPKWCVDKCFDEPFFTDLAYRELSPQFLPRGKILGTVELVNTVRSEMWLAGRSAYLGNEEDTPVYELDSEWRSEYAYGDYSPGRFAFELANPKPFAVPIPARGYQRWWNYDIAV